MGLRGQRERKGSWCGSGHSRTCCERVSDGKGGFKAHGLLAGLLGVILVSTQPSSCILFLELVHAHIHY